ncbi:MAG: hypothetical protein BWY66_00546 [bacterium ADurb.Bin374]|nr:MAG: hypothetical protein BWY66_00546 [bacterium ADurb.Bin374]
MENHQKKAGFVGKPRTLKSGYPTFNLTENEAYGAIVVYKDDLPDKLFVATKRPDSFPVGARMRFRNKMMFYGWTVDRTEPLEFGRSHVILHNPEKVYRKNATAAARPAI